MAAGTVASRATGLARTAALAAALGVTRVGDAYNAANTLPNMLFMLAAGGVLSSVLIPLLARETDIARRRDRAEVTAGLVLLLTGAMALAAAVLAPLLIAIFAVAVPANEASAFRSVGADWLMLFAPQIVAYGVSVHAVAVLNTQGRLALAGFAPVATNLLTIGATVWFVAARGPVPPTLEGVAGTPLLILGIGTTAGVAAMAGLQHWGARRSLGGFRPRLRLRDPVTGELWRRGRWTLGYVAVNQVGLVAVLALANAVRGGVAAYQWAFAIMQLPFAIAAVSVLSALYPRLAADGAAEYGVRFADRASRGLALVVALMVPAGIGLAVLATPVAAALLGYGAAAETGTDLVAAALRWFAVALVPFSVFQVLLRSAYAIGDTRTPAIVNVAVNVVNVAGAAAAVGLASGAAARLAGLAAAYGLSYVVGCVLLGRMLHDRRPGLFASVPAAGARAALGAVPMALLVARLSPVAAQADLQAVLQLGGVVALGGVVYVLAALCLRSPELRALVRR